MCCAAALTIVAGCGSAKTAVVSPAKAQYIARADAICRTHEQKYRAVVLSLFTFKTSWKVAHREEYAEAAPPSQLAVGTPARPRIREAQATSGSHGLTGHAPAVIC